MNNKTQRIRIVLAALLAILCAGSGLATVASAMGVKIGAPGVYLSAAAAALVFALGAVSNAAAVVSAILFAIGAGAFALTHQDGFAALKTLAASWNGEAADAATLALGERTFIICAAFLAGAIFYGMMSRRELVSVGILAELMLLVTSHAMSDSASLGRAMPGLAGAAMAFALTGGVARDARALRLLAPSALAVLLAALLLPAAGTTWPPLERAALQVRSAFEQYFNFTRERVAFTINEEGFDHAGEVEGRVIAMLGGPATPHQDEVMRVTAPMNALLRGTIRSTYTGYSWVDMTPKSRYLYYDPTHRNVRAEVFDLNLDSPDTAFVDAEIGVELLRSGTSTLFVPGRLSGFEMDMANAVYYNTSGEMFMARQVAPGDKYTLRAWLPTTGSAMRDAVLRAEGRADERYEAILEEYSQLPAGVDAEVYRLTMEVTSGATTTFDRAEAIRGYLAGHMRYTLNADYPPAGRDFVSYFLLDSREGYCSYFASAMAVMGRIAGLPTRYVEGYLARPDAEGVATVTGQDAHAWAEVYFKGIGWISFDATAAAMRGGDGAGDGYGENHDFNDGSQQVQSPEVEETPTPSPEPEATLPPDDGATEDEPSPEPEATPTPQPDVPPIDDPPQGASGGGDAPDGGNREKGHWPWWLLLLAALAAMGLAVSWVRRRLRASDPILLSRQAKPAAQAAMILYRANLTLLNHMGQAPINGETPEAFAERVAGQFGCEDYAAFVRAVSRARYGRQPLLKSDVEAGQRAWRKFSGDLGRRERVRFAARRVIHGLGDFENIP